MFKGRHDGFVLQKKRKKKKKGSDASQGRFAIMYDGPRPAPVQKGNSTPMRKEGAIILGTGGEQSNGDRGNFYEGCSGHCHCTW